MYYVRKGAVTISKLAKAYVRSFNLDFTREAKAFYACIEDLFTTPEVQSLAQYEQHLEINRLQHITSVSYLSYLICRRLGLRYREAARGAILHDLFYYDWRDKYSHPRPHAYLHPGIALKNARALCGDGLSAVEANAIHRHMWPLTVIPPRHAEGLVVSLSDKYCAMYELYLSLLPAGKRKLRAILNQAGQGQENVKRV